MVFTIEKFQELAIESYPEWDLNPKPWISVQTTGPSGHDFNWHWKLTLVKLLQFHLLFSAYISFHLLPSSDAPFSLIKLLDR